MGYRWKPNKQQREEYRKRMQERDSLPVKTTQHAIRVGCWIKWYSTSLGATLEGDVVNSSYGAKKNQHTFTIETEHGKILVKGRNLYPNILEHKQGAESKTLD